MGIIICDTAANFTHVDVVNTFWTFPLQVSRVEALPTVGRFIIYRPILDNYLKHCGLLHVAGLVRLRVESSYKSIVGDTLITRLNATIAESAAPYL